MIPIQLCALPQGTLLQTYRQSGAYTDCYVTEIGRAVSHAQFVEAFYTTAVFKLERLLLAWFLSRPSTDEDARNLASGSASAFAAWSVEARAPDQLLLCDIHRRTRSWLMCVPNPSGKNTQLFFGSAVVPLIDHKTGEARMGVGFTALLGFHKLYSRVLLRAAAGRLLRAGAKEISSTR